MPIRLFTGLPGASKTALLVEHLVHEATRKETEKEPRRPIWFHGIDGLIDGLGTRLDDATQWNALDLEREGTCTCGHTKKYRADGTSYLEPGRPPHAHVIPDGALIYMDEAWKNFGHLQDASRQATPAHVLELAEHRHRGIDFVWTTQMPNQIFPFARGLVAGHSHIVRRYGTQFIDVYTWEELNEDVKSVSKRENAAKKTRMIPKEVFDKYKSASLHTIKAKLPLRLFVLPVAIIGAIACAYFAYQTLKPQTAHAGEAATAESAVGDPATPAHNVSAAPLTVEQYIERLKPRIATMPWSIPALDEREVVAEPDLICSSAGAGEDANGNHREASCTCLTEQGTPYPLEPAICEMTAVKGRPYNHFKEPARQNSRGGTARGSDARRPTEDAPNVATLEAEQVSGYGDLGERDLTSATE